MALRTYAFFGFSLPKEQVVTNDTLMTKTFWFSLIEQYINETTDETGKKYAKMAKEYIVYDKFSSDYNSMTQNAFTYYAFMSHRHVDQYKMLINPILILATEKYGMTLAHEHVTILPETVNQDVFHADLYIDEGFRFHIPQQLGYIS